MNTIARAITSPPCCQDLFFVEAPVVDPFKLMAATWQRFTQMGVVFSSQKYMAHTETKMFMEVSLPTKGLG